MKANRVSILFVSMIALILGGCGLISGLDDARSVAERFFEDRFVNGGVGNDEFYSEIFWKNTNTEQWEYIKKVVAASLGELQSYSLISWNVHSKFNSGQLSGTFVVLVFQTEYENGSGQEKITLLKKLGHSEFEIIGHHIESDKINEMVLKGVQKVSGQDI